MRFFRTAEGGSRTLTPLRARDFESRASANSATSALLPRLFTIPNRLSTPYPARNPFLARNPATNRYSPPKSHHCESTLRSATGGWQSSLVRPNPVSGSGIQSGQSARPDFLQRKHSFHFLTPNCSEIANALPILWA